MTRAKGATTPVVPLTVVGSVGGAYMAAWAWRCVLLIEPVIHE